MDGEGNFSVSKTGTLVYSVPGQSEDASLSWMDLSGRETPIPIEPGDLAASLALQRVLVERDGWAPVLRGTEEHAALEWLFGSVGDPMRVGRGELPIVKL